MSDHNSTLKRLQSLSLFRTPKKEESVHHVTNSECPFLRLSPELRLMIYEHAFARTPTEHFETLHHGPSANSASGLMLVCRQIRSEAQEYYNKDSLINLWPHFFRDGQHIDEFASVPPVVNEWRKSRHGRILRHHPERVHQLGLLINLTREENSMAHDYVDSSILKHPQLQPKDLYIRVCICMSLQWLHDTPFGIMSFCIALEVFANHFPTLERIHIMYCGQHWPKWLETNEDDVHFPEIVLARHTVRMFSGANWSIQRMNERTKSWAPTTQRDPAHLQPPPKMSVVEGSDLQEQESCKLRTMMTWNYSSQAHPGDNVMKAPWKERNVEINYYDSRAVLGVQCVRDKPPQPQGSSCALFRHS